MAYPLENYLTVPPVHISKVAEGGRRPYDSFSAAPDGQNIEESAFFSRGSSFHKAISGKQEEADV